ncbi:MAG: hypothetical protein KKD44_28775 [Proteobacteria bacterium]|nr:hypothetical protein [Pseudomonadota bacterium]
MKELTANYNVLNDLFSTPKIIGLVANTNEGKSNMIYYLLEELNKKYNFKVYTYGLRCNVPKTLKFNSVAELEQIKNSVILIDELFSLFDVENKRARRQIENTLRLIFHNNNVLLLCGLGEGFKKFISAKLHTIIFKKVTFADLINGSMVKNVVMGYQGEEKGSSILNLDVDESIIYDGLHYHKVKIPYMEQYDSKRNNKPILVKKC